MLSSPRARVISAVCGLLAGPVLLIANWAGVLAQPDAYSFVNHASSDLGADTADVPWLSNQLGSNLPGLLLLVFAIGLWYSVGRHPSARIGSLLVGVVGLGIFLTGFLTLDCREIDAECENTSWQATAHVITAGPTLLGLVLSPFVVARALKQSPRWRDLRVPTLVLGIGTIAAAIAGSAIGEGLGQYAAVIVWFAWITVLAVRMFRLAGAEAATTLPAIEGDRLRSGR
jgi:hypothetical protein